jgi:ribonuclease Z
MDNFKEIQVNKLIKITGFSRGSLRTGFIILPYKIFLDSGVSFNIKPNLILLTHGHQDHIDTLYTNLMDTTKIEVVGTKNLLLLLQDYLNACKSVNMGRKVKFNNWKPIPIINEYITKINNIKFYIESISLPHEVECIGYGINEIREKLLEIHIDKSPKEIVELKKSEKITEEIKFPLLFFCGDMGYTGLEILPFEKYALFIIECTFFEEEHLEEAIERQHLHIFQLLPYIEKYKKTKFVLIHFSLRYTMEELKNYQKKYNFNNLIFFL